MRFGACDSRMLDLGGLRPGCRRGAQRGAHHRHQRRGQRAGKTRRIFLQSGGKNRAAAKAANGRHRPARDGLRSADRSICQKHERCGRSRRAQGAAHLRQCDPDHVDQRRAADCREGRPFRHRLLPAQDHARADHRVHPHRQADHGSEPGDQAVRRSDGKIFDRLDGRFGQYARGPWRDAQLRHQQLRRQQEPRWTFLYGGSGGRKNPHQPGGASDAAAEVGLGGMH